MVKILIKYFIKETWGGGGGGRHVRFMGKTRTFYEFITRKHLLHCVM